MVRRPGGWQVSSWVRRGRGVHRQVSQPISVGVGLTSDVLEGNAANLARQRSRLGVQRLQARVLDFEIAEHLLNEQQRVGADEQFRRVMRAGPLERGEQPPVFGDVPSDVSIRTPNPAGPGLPRAPPSM
jgi:hypothetical protein